ncbi:MAG: ABC transporter substrate-binding protein [Yoonia sp.]|uniref:ABC transporter substrate-binding protein n=1 Tax=Yoonia sp. TaxID=2212373 RepID=UPI003EFAD25B
MRLFKPFAFTLLPLMVALPAWAQEFPLTIEHKFGTTVIEQRPERIASLDFAGADDLLALGVQPVAIRYWYGDHPRSVWPWAEPLLTTAPVILRGDLNFEAIASSTPDVIIALWSGITADEYKRLSQIAPVVVVPDGIGDFAMAWNDRARLTGRAIGKEDDAAALIAAIETRLETIAEPHPEWTAKTITINYVHETGIGTYTGNDVRPQLFSKLGFSVPEAINDLADDGDFYVNLGFESVELLEADLILWLAYDGTEPIRTLTGRSFLKAHQDGREVIIGANLAGAFSHASLLSLPFLFDQLAPMLETALGGDPNTHSDDH